MERPPLSCLLSALPSAPAVRPCRNAQATRGGAGGGAPPDARPTQSPSIRCAHKETYCGMHTKKQSPSTQEHQCTATAQTSRVMSNPGLSVSRLVARDPRLPTPRCAPPARVPLFAHWSRNATPDGARLHAHTAPPPGCQARRAAPRSGDCSRVPLRSATPRFPASAPPHYLLPTILRHCWAAAGGTPAGRPTELSRPLLVRPARRAPRRATKPPPRPMG